MSRCVRNHESHERHEKMGAETEQTVVFFVVEERRIAA